MKKPYIAICTLMAVIIIHSCSSYRNEENKELTRSEESLRVENSEIETEFYVCQGDTILVENIVGPTRLWLYKPILKCLNETGAFGDVEANKQIAKIITKTGYEGLIFFASTFPMRRLRGKDIFEAILNLGPDDTRQSYDGEYGYSTYTAINTQYLTHMIESIGGI